MLIHRRVPSLVLPDIHQVMATFGPTGKEVVRVVDCSGIHRAHTLASTLAHWQARLRLQFLPARCGHHLNPMEGFWRVLKDKFRLRTLGASARDASPARRVRESAAAPSDAPQSPEQWRWQ